MQNFNDYGHLFLSNIKFVSIVRIPLSKEFVLPEQTFAYHLTGLILAKQ